MNYEVLTPENAKKLADYDKLENERDYYKSELDLLTISYRRQESEIKNLKKQITVLKKEKNSNAERS